MYNSSVRPLQRLETFLQRMFERPGRLLLAQKLHPLELAGALERAMEDNSKPLIGRAAAPNVFTLRLHPTDYGEFLPVREALEHDLVDRIGEIVQGRGYRLVGPLRIALQADPAIDHGEVAVETAFAAPAAQQRTQSPPPTEQPPPSEPPRRSTAPLRPPGPASTAPLQLRLQRQDGTTQSWPLIRLPCTIGRANDNDIHLAEPVVSRHHARIEREGETLVIRDLGSANGTKVNGRPVQTAPLHPGDRIDLGGLILTCEREG